MKTCSDACEPYCDFCRNYREYRDIDAEDDFSSTGFGYCLVRSEIMSFDWGSGCDDFYCRSAWRMENSSESGEACMDTKDENSRKVSRRDLKSYASGTVTMFACSSQHYAWLAQHHGIAHVEIDLLTLQIQPEQFDIERNRILAGHCQNSLMRNIRKLSPPAAVISAKLSADFGINDFTEDEYGTLSAGKTVYAVTLTDDRGKEWTATITDERVLAED